MFSENQKINAPMRDYKDYNEADDQANANPSAHGIFPGGIKGSGQSDRSQKGIYRYHQIP